MISSHFSTIMNLRPVRPVTLTSDTAAPRSQQARQHGFANDADRWEPLLGRAVVSGRDDDDQIEIGQHIKPLAAIAGAADPMFQPHGASSEKFHVAEVPLIAIA